jgi:hypothetical protein
LLGKGSLARGDLLLFSQTPTFPIRHESA